MIGRISIAPPQRYLFCNVCGCSWGVARIVGDVCDDFATDSPCNGVVILSEYNSDIRALQTLAYLKWQRWLEGGRN